MDTLKMGSDKKNVTPLLDKASTKCYTNNVKGRVRLDKRRLKIIHWQASSQDKKFKF